MILGFCGKTAYRLIVADYKQEGCLGETKDQSTSQNGDPEVYRSPSRTYLQLLQEIMGRND